MCGKEGCTPETVIDTVVVEYHYGGFDYAAFLLRYHLEWWDEMMAELAKPDSQEWLDDSFPRFLKEVMAFDDDGDFFEFQR